MEYKILSHTKRNKLEDLVNQALVNGWQLQGGIAIAPIGTETGYAQAIIKV